MWRPDSIGPDRACKPRSGGRSSRRSSGSELFYISAGQVMVARIRPGRPFSIVSTETLRPRIDLALGFEIGSDGDRVLTLRYEDRETTQVNVVLNWPELLGRQPQQVSIPARER